MIDETLIDVHHRGQIDAVLSNDRLSDHQKRKLLRKMRDPLASGVRQLERELAPLSNKKKMLEEAIEWGEKAPVIQRADGSRFHKLLEAHRSDNILWAVEDKDALGSWLEANLSVAQSFVLQHDWAAAFSGAGEFGEGEFQIPANPVIFEMKISGNHVAVLIGDDKSGIQEGVYFVQTSLGWVASGPKPCELSRRDEGAVPGWAQIRAMCIALEADVATTEIVRAPHRLNMARERRGNLPIRDYHVVSLAKRSRVQRLDSSGHERRGPRLHFRRGHWRHFDNYKTWIRWTLVGDPDIGFIDKEYRL